MCFYNADNLLLRLNVCFSSENMAKSCQMPSARKQLKHRGPILLMKAKQLILSLLLKHRRSSSSQLVAEVWLPVDILRPPSRCLGAPGARLLLRLLCSLPMRLSLQMLSMTMSASCHCLTRVAQMRTEMCKLQLPSPRARRTLNTVRFLVLV